MKQKTLTQTAQLLNRIASHLFLTYCETGMISDKEAWCLIEELLDGETKTLVAQGIIRPLEAERDNYVRSEVSRLLADIRTSTGSQPQA